MTESTRTFPDGEFFVGLNGPVGGALYVVTNLAIYRLDGDHLRPLVISAEPPVAASAENIDPEVFGECVFEASRAAAEDGLAGEAYWTAVAQQALENYALIRAWAPNDVSEEDAARTQVEPGPVTFDPHVGSPLASDDGFVDNLRRMRERNGLS